MADPRFTEPDNDDKTHLPSGMSARNLRAAALPVMGADSSRRHLGAAPVTLKYGGG